jgi:hypothetical protein
VERKAPTAVTLRPQDIEAISFGGRDELRLVTVEKNRQSQLPESTHEVMWGVSDRRVRSSIDTGVSYIGAIWADRRTLVSLGTDGFLVYRDIATG